MVEKAKAIKSTRAKSNLARLGLAGLPELIENVSGTMVALQEKMSKTEKDFKDFRDTIKEQNKVTEEGAKKVNKYGNEINAMGIAISRANKRTSILNNALKRLSDYDKPKTFELFSVKSFKAYMDAGGSAFEYFAEFLTNSREDIRIMTFEAAKLRRFVFGFIPGGFTFLSKIGFTLQFIGSTLRTFLPRTAKDLKENTDEMGKFQKAIGGVFGFLGGKRGKDAFKNPIKGMKAFIKQRKQVNKLAKKSKVDKLAFSNISFDDSEERAKREIELKEKIANYKPKLNMNKIDTTAKDLEAMKNELKTLQSSNIQIGKPMGSDEREAIKKFFKQSTIMKLAQRKIDKRIAKEKKAAFKSQLKSQMTMAKKRLETEKEYGEKKKEMDEFLRKAHIRNEKKAIAAVEQMKKKGLVSDFDQEIELINLKKKQLDKEFKESRIGKRILKRRKNIVAKRKEIRELQDFQQGKIEAAGKRKGLTAEDFEKISFRVSNMGIKGLIPRILNTKPVKLFKKVGGAIFSISRKVTYFFLGFMAFIVGLFLLLKLIGPALKASFEAIKTVFLFGLSMILPAISTIWEGLKGLWNVAFGGGSLTDLINSVVTLAYGILQLVVGIAIATLGTLLTLAVTTLFNIGVKIGEKISQIGNKGKLALLAGVIFAFVAWWFTAPVWLVALIGFVVFKAVSIFLKSGPKALWDAFMRINFVKLIADAVTSLVFKVLSKLPVIGKRFKKRATGGVVGVGETTLVGEKGPELVNLPAGSNVFTNRQTRSMMGSTVNNFNITINAKDTSKEEMRRIADEIGKQVVSRIFRRKSHRSFS